MALRDIGTFLSRYFVIGFYVPSFIGVVALVVVLRRDWVPDQLELTDNHNQLLQSGLGSHLLATAIVALPIGLVLIGIWSHIFRFYRAAPFFGLDVNYPRLQPVLLWKKRRTWDRLWGQTLSPDRFARNSASLRLSERFPAQRELVQPTYFSNVVRAYEEYAQNRWGLDYPTVWPRIEALFTEQEQALHDDARTNLSFAVDLSLVALIVGVLRTVGVFWPFHGVDWHWGLFLNLIPLAVSYAVYRLIAIDAVVAGGRRIRASLDLHRLELYEKLGVPPTTPFSDRERDLGKALSRYLLSGERSEELGRQDWARGKAQR